MVRDAQYGLRRVWNGAYIRHAPAQGDAEGVLTGGATAEETTTQSHTVSGPAAGG